MMDESYKEGDEHGVVLVQNPPSSIPGILRRLGPGLIIAGGIVGSGELIATTKTGAEAGIALLWLIIVGCVIKVFTQVEFGRFSISTGQTALDGMNQVPGPRLRVGWLVWYWVIMFAFSTAQLGGVVGGVGQALAISLPITGDFNELIDKQQEWDKQAAPLKKEFDENHPGGGSDKESQEEISSQREAFLETEIGSRPNQDSNPTRDDFYWALIITIPTSLMLYFGRYNMMQSIATLLVFSFTLITIGNVFAMQTQEKWALSWQDLKTGLSFGLPEAVSGSLKSPLVTALATFGIIGVGASELVAYPYWCLEKGYARFTGPRDESSQWAQRATGWLRVLRWDAWVAMVLYTISTVAFYLLGASVLYSNGLNPAKEQLIPVLADMYEPAFGEYARMIFLFGAFAVLYSTFFVGSAGAARIVADAVRVFGVGAKTEKAQLWWKGFFCAALPFASLFVFAYVRAPALLVLASGLIQAIMLPMLGGAALFFRYKRCDARIRPGKLWDIFLWISALGMLVTGGTAAYKELF